MGLLSFLGFLLRLVGVAFTATIVIAVVIAVLIFFRSSEIEQCPLVDGTSVGPASPDPARSLAFQAKWLAFLATADSGRSITFSADEVSSRATFYLRDEIDLVKKVLFCFEPGGAEASVTLAGPFGRHISARAEGIVDLSSGGVRVDLARLKAGGVAAPSPLRELFEDRLNRELDDLRLSRGFDVSFDHDRVTITTRR